MSRSRGSSRRWLVVALASAGLHAAPALGKAAYVRLSTLDAPVEARLGARGVEAALRARDVARYLGIQSVDDVPAARAALVESARAPPGAAIAWSSGAS
ncbi:MAG: hypothetical protein IPM79_25225 [Polyangiaceae bacterium]|nr:hypothetical protein [Polyangiaceae bacterium]